MGRFVVVTVVVNRFTTDVAAAALCSNKKRDGINAPGRLVFMNIILIDLDVSGTDLQTG